MTCPTWRLTAKLCSWLEDDAVFVCRLLAKMTAPNGLVATEHLLCSDSEALVVESVQARRYSVFPRRTNFFLGLAILALVHCFCGQRRHAVTLPLPQSGTLVHEKKRFTFGLV